MKTTNKISIILFWMSLVLLFLKITTHPELNWGWVFAPLWIPCAIGIIGICIVVIFFSLYKKKK